MGTFKQREDYLKSLCQQHDLVAHDAIKPDGDGKRNSFFRLNDEEELVAGSVNDIDFPCVCHLLLEGRIKDKDNALIDIRHSFKNGWVFLSHVETPEDSGSTSDAVQAAYDESFGIMEDFIKMMKDDFETNGSCGAFTDINFNEMNYVPVGPVITNEYGWILYFNNEQKATRII